MSCTYDAAVAGSRSRRGEPFRFLRVLIAKLSGKEQIMTSLSKNARIAGLLYLTLLTAPLRLVYIPNKLFVVGNASATANNIATHEMLFRLGILSDLLTGTMVIFLTLALYRLFKGVDEGLARLVVILGALVVTPIYFLNTVNDAAALLFARGPDFLSAFDKPQRDALVMVFLRMHHQGVLANEIFWGLWLFPLRPAGLPVRVPSARPRRLADAELLRLSRYERHRHAVAAI
jgi:hypothetical protein